MDCDPTTAGFGGVLLAGGTAARLGGIDKASIELDGRTLLEICLDAFLDADEVVVVGPQTVRPARPVTFTLEDPPRGGPVAGLLTGVDALTRPTRLIGVLAVDMPRVSAATFTRLREASIGHEGAFLYDATGRRQLCGVIRADALERTRPDPEGQQGMALRALLAPLDLAEVAALGPEARDVDTWADLRDIAGDPLRRDGVGDRLEE